jgi:hypothetical protein
LAFDLFAGPGTIEAIVAMRERPVLLESGSGHEAVCA